MADARQPNFGTALVAVLAGGVVSSWISALFVGVAPYMSVEMWSIVTSLFGAIGIKLVLRLLNYDCPFAFAAGALLAGRVASLALVQAMPDLAGHELPVFPSFGVFSALPGLVLAAFVVQISAGRRRVATY
jgi:hypothetical protein